MPGKKHIVEFELTPDFDLSALVRAFQAASWHASRGRPGAYHGAVLDTPEKDMLSAGLVAIEKGPGAARGVGVWMVPIKGGPAQLILRTRGSRTDGLAKDISLRADMNLEGALAPIWRFETKTIPIDFQSRAGSVRAVYETIAPEGKAATGFLRLETVRGNGNTLALASGLAQLAPGIARRIEDGPRRLLGVLEVSPGPRPVGRLSPIGRMSARRAVLEILRRNYVAALACERGARVGLDGEFVHDMRVATRRMRAVLRLFRGALAKGAADHLVGEIKWLACVLGAVRDLDVYMAAVPKYLAYAKWEPPEYRFYIDALAAKRRTAGDELVKALDSPRYAAFKSEMEEFLAGAPASPRAPSLRALAGKRLGTAFAKAQRAGDKARTDDQLHRARIAFKRARYAAEFTVCLAPKQLNRIARCATTCQDILGGHHDAIVACDRVREALRAEEDRLHTFLLGYLLACQRLMAIESRRRFLDLWRDGASHEFAALVKAAASKL